jgi:hypothetical protein
MVQSYLKRYKKHYTEIFGETMLEGLYYKDQSSKVTQKYGLTPCGDPNW